VGGIADGVVIGSKIVTLIKEAPPGKAREAIQAYCQEVIRPRTDHEQKGVSHDIGLGEALDNAKVEAEATPTATISRPEEEANGFVDQLENMKKNPVNGKPSYEVYITLQASF
jgi:tryptophan synthase